MVNNIDILNICDYLYDDDELKYLDRELDNLVERLTMEVDFGDLSLDYGSTHLALRGKYSRLDELRCKIYPVHAAKKSEYSEVYFVKRSHIICQIVTGSGGKEIWVEISDDPYPVVKDNWNSTREFKSKDDAEKFILENNMLRDDENNALLRKFWKFLQEYAEKRECAITLECEGGLAEEAIIILGNGCPWRLQAEEDILQRLQL